MCEERTAPPFLHHHSRVILHRTLWPEQGVTHVGVVEVVECRHAIATLSKGAKHEHWRRQRLPPNKDGGAERRYGVGGVERSCVVFGCEAHDRSLRLETSEVECRRHCKAIAEAMRVSEARKVGTELIPTEVIACRQAPLRQQFHHVGRRHIQLLLAKRVVDMHLRGVVVDVARVVIGIFSKQLCRKPAPYRPLHHALHKRVVVCLALATTPHVVDNGTRYAATRVVCVSLQVPRPLAQSTIEVAF